MDMQWNDLLSFHWLTRFEMYLHRLLHYLDTPVAPFLRLEQMATASHIQHKRITRYAVRYKQYSDICQHADAVMVAIGTCAFALVPEQGGSINARDLGDYSPWFCPWIEHQEFFDRVYQH